MSERFLSFSRLSSSRLSFSRLSFIALLLGPPLAALVLILAASARAISPGGLRVGLLLITGFHLLIFALLFAGSESSGESSYPGESSSPGERSPLAEDRRSPPAFLPLFFLFLQCFLAGAGFYFSDDALRHIYDGNLLLQGADVYRTAPRELGAFAGILPNHPELPTIYLPFTQLQAIAGALVSPRFGFLFIFHFLSGMTALAVYYFLRPKERAAWLFFLFSPYFLLVSSSHHADVQGFLFIALVLVGTRFLREQILAGRFGREELRTCFLLGFFTGLPIGLKPEGGAWALFFLFAFAFIVRLPEKKARLAFYSGFFAALAILGGTAFFILFPDLESLRSLGNTIRVFTGSFVAYNPFLVLLPRILDRPLEEIIGPYQGAVLFLAAGGLLFLGLRLTGWKNSSSSADAGGRTSRPALALLWALASFLFFRGVWHPWYFLWLLPALLLLGKTRLLLGLVVCLPLFYLPVIELRASGVWDFNGFYFVFCGYFLLWILLTGKPMAGLIQIWSKKRAV